MSTPQGLRNLAEALYCRALWAALVRWGLVTSTPDIKPHKSKG